MAPHDPAAAADQALLAVAMSERLTGAYDPNLVLDLQARAHAQLAEARRRLGELHGAGEELRRAEECLARSTTGSPGGDLRPLAGAQLARTLEPRSSPSRRLSREAA
ncbi:MAG TPA: hypothetical protein VHQ90_15165 [Thermoanaerobaculia bacterium]|nr:hypothetical protein [Thermoanaerobaculia bacterium]